MNLIKRGQSMKKYISIIISIILFFAMKCYAGNFNIYSQDTTNLIGSWTLGRGSYADPVVYGSHGSDDLTAVHSPVYTTGPNGRTNGALLFDGTNDYLTQKVHDTQAGGSYYASTIAANAFMIDESQDFSPWVGASGDTPYMIDALDGGGVHALGYLGEEGTGETLGSELVTNGDFSAWTDDNPDGYTVNGESGTDPEISEVSSAEGHGGVGTGSCNLYTSDGTFVAVTQTILTIGKLYKYSVDIKVINSGTLRVTEGGSTVNTYNSTGIKTGYFTARAGIYVEIKRTIGATDITFDDLSVKEVLTPPATTGIKIYSTKDGGTQSFAGTTDFNANEIASYEIRKSDFQITGAMTLGALIKTGTKSSEVMSKYNSSYDARSYNFYLQSDGYLRFDISSTGGGGGDLKAATGTTDLTDNSWHFIVGVFDPSSYVRIYSDGVQVGENVTSIPATIYDSFEKLYVAGLITSDLFNGSISSTFIYDRALTATEILNLYEAQDKVFLDTTSGDSVNIE
jgi:hypothetical protein